VSPAPTLREKRQHPILVKGKRQRSTGEAPPAYVERTFRRCLECGILAHGFARAYCHECQRDFLIAYSCKGRDVCPSCSTRRRVDARKVVQCWAAHSADHVFPPLPARRRALFSP